MESTLAIAKTELDGEIGLFLGYGRGEDNGEPAWSAKQRAAIQSLRKTGENQVYYTPAVVELGIPPGYEWSFLKPVDTIVVPSGSASVPLPDDFNMLEGDVSLGTATWQQWTPIAVVGPGQILQASNRFPDSTGQPQMVAVVPVKGTTLTKGQRFRLDVYPTADQAYSLRVAYSILPDAMSDTRPYALGGASHAETFKASCIAAAELYLDDMRGPRYAHFLDRLAASIALDRRHKQQHYGYMGDRQDERMRRPRVGEYRVPFNGVYYD